MAGQRKLIIGYDKNTTIKHPDYRFITWQYDYQELFIMEARKDDAGNLGLFDIRGLSGLNEKFKQMSRPFSVGIKLLSLIQEPVEVKKILTQYEFLRAGKKLINYIPIELKYMGDEG